MNIKRAFTIIYLLIILIISSCSVSNKYEQVKATKSITSYESFISKYPKSKYAVIARQELEVLYEERDWNKAMYFNTILTYDEFISKYPNSRFIPEAKKRIRKVEEQNAWDMAKYLNTIYGYESFLKTYPNSKFKFEANYKIKILKEKKVWNEVNRIGTIDAYKKFIIDFPAGEFSKEAEKKIIDLEVEAIFKSDHGLLPPMTKTSYGFNNSSSTKIEIENNTSYTLTVRYSGPESMKIELKPKQKKQITIKNGDYKVAASVDAANVQNYAGTSKLEGGSYSSMFYILYSFGK